MRVLLYEDLLHHPLMQPAHWLIEHFAAQPDSVAVVMTQREDWGCVEWIVANPGLAVIVHQKIRMKSRVCTLASFNDYLACFGDKPALTCKEAALLLDGGERALPGPAEEPGNSPLPVLA